MFKKTFLYFVVCMLLSGLVYINPIQVSADTLPIGSKSVDGFVKFIGQGTVNDYILVQPADMLQWNDCQGITEEYADSVQKQFYLLNDGPLCNFGSENHCYAYYNPVAIPKKYISEITLVKEGLAIQENPTATDANYNQNSFDISNAPIYATTCASHAYKEAIPTNFIIPHETSTVSEKSPIVRKDFIVRIVGVDKEKKKLLLRLEDTFVRTGTTISEAESFVKSLTQQKALLNH